MNFLKFATIILFIILTIFTIKIHPDMHQPVIIEDEHFKLTRISDTISTNEYPKTKSIKTSQPTQIQEQIPEQTTQTIEITEPNQVQNTSKYIDSNPQKIKNTERRVVNNNTPDNTSQLELLQQILEQAEKEEFVELPKTQQREVQRQTPQKNKNPYMTEQEEIIAWNRWRSNLQNQIMRDSQIDYAPLGTLFTFTFVVDKYGNISNVKVQCSNPNYMDVARNKVKPAITNLQRKPILNFPRGSQRTSTVVIGGFLIGTQEIFSTPEQFSDYERISY